MEGRAATEAEKAAAKSPQAKGRYATWKENWLKSRKQTRSPLTGKFQAKPETLRGYSYQKAKNLGSNVYKYGYKYPARYVAGSKPASWGKRLFKTIITRGRHQEGGFVDSMDPDYGNPDLYRFTGGGDFDYFGDQAYIGYEDVTDPYMPYMVDGGSIPMADNGGQYPMTETEYYRSQQFYDDMDNKSLENQGAFYPTQSGMAPPNSRTENISAQSRKNLLDPGRASTRTERMRKRFPNVETVARSYDANQLARQQAETLRNESMGRIGKSMRSAQTNKIKPRKMGYKSMYEYGGIPMADEGLYVDPSKKTYQEYLDWHNEEPVEEGYARAKPLSESEWMAEQGFKTQVNPNSGDARKDLYNSLSDAQKEMYQAAYKKMQNRGYRGYGYGQYPYRRGIFNTMMGIQAPAAIRRAGSWLSPYIGPTYSDGTPVIGGIPTDAKLSTIEYNRRGLFERMFPGKDAEGNRLPRGPRKSVKYTFNLPGTDGAAASEPSGPTSIEDAKAAYKEKKKAKRLDARSARQEGRQEARETRQKGRATRQQGRQKDRADRKSERTFRKIGRRAEDLYNYMSQEPLSEEGKARMEMGYSYGGMSVGDERYMTADEIAQFMAAGGQIEFL